MDGLGPLLLLPGHLRPGLEDAVHVLHELQLLAPQVLLPDELTARPLVLLLLPLLLRPAPGEERAGRLLCMYGFPADLPDPGIEPRSPALQADSLLTELSGKPNGINTYMQ